MEVVRRDDDDRLDAVRPLGLGFGHLAIVGIGAVLGDADIEAGKPRVFGIGGQRAGNQLGSIVEPERHAVDRADEGVAAASHHAQRRRLRTDLVAGCVNHGQAFNWGLHFRGMRDRRPWPSCCALEPSPNSTEENTAHKFPIVKK